MVETLDDPRRVKIVASVGLVVVAACAALCMVVFDRIAPHVEKSLGIESRQEFKPGGVSYDTLKNSPLSTLPVDPRAAQEIKKQTPTQNAPAPSQPSTVVSTPTGSKYSLAVFVGTDAKSNTLLDWFNRDPSLQRMRSAVNFQAYTKDNPIYRDRFASVVPIDQFPAVLFTDAHGGHVYAAGGDFLPSSARALYRDLQDAYEIQKQVTIPGGTDATQTQLGTGTADCPDGNCKPFDTPRPPLLNPDREPLFPSIRPRPDVSIESLLYWIWNPGEALLAVCCAALFALLLLVVCLKVIRS